MGKKIVHVYLREYPIRPDRQNYEAEPKEEISAEGMSISRKSLRVSKMLFMIRLSTLTYRCFYITFG
jgi:hypothetical protein